MWPSAPISRTRRFKVNLVRLACSQASATRQTQSFRETINPVITPGQVHSLFESAGLGEGFSFSVVGYGLVPDAMGFVGFPVFLGLAWSRASVRVGKAGFTYKFFLIRGFTTLISEASGTLKTKTL